MKKRKENSTGFCVQIGSWLNAPENGRYWKPAAGALVLALIVSTALLGRYYYNAWQTEIAVEALRAAKSTTAPESLQVSAQTASMDTNPVLPPYRELYEQNGDLVGWITIQGTNIDYPVMQTPDDPQFYMDKDFARKDSDHGLPFADALCDLNEKGANVIVYGHNMKSGLIFADLLNYSDKSYWEQHPVIAFDTLYEQREYAITAVFLSHVPSDIPYSFVSPESRDAVDDVLTQAQELSFYDTGVSAEYGDDFLTLSTCDYDTDEGRLVVMAKRIA